MSDCEESDGVQQTPPLRSRSGPGQGRTSHPVSTRVVGVLGLGIWVLVGALVTAIFSTRVRGFLSTFALWILLAFVGTVILMVLVRALEKHAATASPTVRRAPFALVLLPLIVLAVIAIVFLASTYQAFVVRVVFVLVACLIPGAMYYLFIATRRPSILNEFIGNLFRLGLFDTIRWQPGTQPGDPPEMLERPDERRARVQGYFQKFEAVYGALWFEEKDMPYTRDALVDNLLEAVDQDFPAFASGRLPQAGVRLTDFFRGKLLLPLGVATVLCALGWLLTLYPEWKSPLEPASSVQSSQIVVAPAHRIAEKQKSGAPDTGDDALISLMPEWTPVNFAFLGAYFFGLQMLFRRFVRRDLGSNAYLAFSLRILLAYIAAWIVIAAFVILTNGVDNVPEALAEVCDKGDWPPALLIITFVVGVFPRMIWQILQAVLVKITFLKIVLPSVAAKQPLSDLDGLTIWHESRLEEEDIENVPNMATADIVDLILHTQIPAERVIAWVDESILHLVLGQDQENNLEKTRRWKLRQHGIGTASQLVFAYMTSDSADRPKLETILGAGETTTPPLRTIVRTVQLEPNYDLVRAWRRIG